MHVQGNSQTESEEQVALGRFDASAAVRTAESRGETVDQGARPQPRRTPSGISSAVLLVLDVAIGRAPAIAGCSPGTRFHARSAMPTTAGPRPVTTGTAPTTRIPDHPVPANR